MLAERLHHTVDNSNNTHAETERQKIIRTSQQARTNRVSQIPKISERLVVFKHLREELDITV